MIHVDINPGELGHNYSSRVPILGDAKVTLQHLVEALGQSTVILKD